MTNIAAALRQFVFADIFFIKYKDQQVAYAYNSYLLHLLGYLPLITAFPFNICVDHKILYTFTGHVMWLLVNEDVAAM